MVRGDDLKNRPLVEAVFELRWYLTGVAPGPLVDPNYKLLVGSLYGAIRDEYPYHEQLPTATVPDELVPYLIQHRFRASEGGYPLLQVGPGIFAVNDTSGYSWRTYLPRVLSAVGKLRETYDSAASPTQLLPRALTLRYIDAVPFDYATGDLFAYMRENLKVSIGYPEPLFANQAAERRPSSIILQTTHTLTDPVGVVLLKFSTGEVNGQPHLIWETQVQSTEGDVPGFAGLEQWMQRAHDVVRAWFFTLIEGKLETEFQA